MAFNVLSYIALDIHQMQLQTIHAKQYDNKSRYLNIRVVDKTEQIDLHGYSLYFKAHTSKGRNILKEVSVLGDGSAIVELDGNILYDSGKTQAELQIVNLSDSAVLSTMPFLLYITPSVFADEDMTQSQEYQLFWEKLQEANETLALIRELEDIVRESEANRVTAEETRASNEDQRISNENQRIANEDQRKQNEDTRIANEDERIENDNDRQNATDEAIQNMKDSTDDALDTVKQITSTLVQQTENATNQFIESTENSVNQAVERAEAATEKTLKALDDLSDYFNEVTDEDAVRKSQLGVPSNNIVEGVATLDENGFVRQEQLPVYFTVTSDDIDAIISGTYTKINSQWVFNELTSEDIDKVIAGTYYSLGI